MPRLKHVPSFDGAFSYGGETWDMDDGIFVVDDESIASDMVDQFTKLSFAESVDVDKTPEVDDTDDYPTNDNGKPLCVGKDDGQCSRTVDEPRGKCWQHS